jgi:hypothetical protein
MYVYVYFIYIYIYIYIWKKKRWAMTSEIHWLKFRLPSFFLNLLIPIASWHQNYHWASVVYTPHLSMWGHRYSRALTIVTTSLLWVHSPEILVCYFFLHKQYKEVDRSERGLCEKIIKSFRECQESIAQHCQHSGVLQAIIRWHGGVRHAWQLIPAWAPREKQRTASRSH